MNMAERLSAIMPTASAMYGRNLFWVMQRLYRELVSDARDGDSFQRRQQFGKFAQAEVRFDALHVLILELRAACDPDRLHFQLLCTMDIGHQTITDHDGFLRCNIPMRERDLKCARMRLAVKTCGRSEHEIEIGTNAKACDQLLHILVIPRVGEDAQLIVL